MLKGNHVLRLLGMNVPHRFSHALDQLRHTQQPENFFSTVLPLGNSQLLVRNFIKERKKFTVEDQTT